MEALNAPKQSQKINKIDLNVFSLHSHASCSLLLYLLFVSLRAVSIFEFDSAVEQQAHINDLILSSLMLLKTVKSNIFLYMWFLPHECNCILLSKHKSVLLSNS